MLVINGKMMLRMNGKLHSPGAAMELPDMIAQKLLNVGLVKVAPETATMPEVENAAMPKPKKRKKKAGAGE